MQLPTDNDIRDPDLFELQQMGSNMKNRVYQLIKSSTTQVEATEKIEKARFPGVLMEGSIKRFLTTHMNSLNRHHYKPLDSFKPEYRVSSIEISIEYSLHLRKLLKYYYLVIFLEIARQCAPEYGASRGSFAIHFW